MQQVLFSKVLCCRGKISKFTDKREQKKFNSCLTGIARLIQREKRKTEKRVTLEFKKTRIAEETQ